MNHDAVCANNKKVLSSFFSSCVYIYFALAYIKHLHLHQTPTSTSKTYIYIKHLHLHQTPTSTSNTYTYIEHLQSTSNTYIYFKDLHLHQTHTSTSKTYIYIKHLQSTSNTHIYFALLTSKINIYFASPISILALPTIPQSRFLHHLVMSFLSLEMPKWFFYLLLLQMWIQITFFTL